MKRIIIAAVLATVSASALANEFPACNVTDATAAAVTKAHIIKYAGLKPAKKAEVLKMLEARKSDYAVKFKEGCNGAYEYGTDSESLKATFIKEFYSYHRADKADLFILQATSLASQGFAVEQKKRGI